MVLVGITDRWSPRGVPRRSWEENIKMELHEVASWQDWTDMA
jgi:hypothetical protein